jgi:uncharacterized protein YjbJ (UPF0337 family)
MRPVSPWGALRKNLPERRESFFVERGRYPELLLAGFECLSRKFYAKPSQATGVSFPHIHFRRNIMDNDRAEGSMKTIKGRMKEGLGKALGDSKMEAEGKMDKAEGKVQNTIGGMKDALRKST